MFKKTLLVSSLLLAVNPQAMAEHFSLPEMSVQGTAGEGTPLELPAHAEASSDSAEWLKKLPGASVNRNGPLTSIAQYRGLFGDRVNTLVDGVRISQAGPNSMDSPLSYIAASQLDNLTLYRGIAPVSSGIETIGGTIEASKKQIGFTHSDEIEFHGQATSGYAHNNDSYQLGFLGGLANQNHRVQLGLTRDKGDDQRFDGGKILPSQHERDSFALGYGYKMDGMEMSLDAEHHDTGNTGTPALPMDILFARGERYKADISQQLTNGGIVSARLNYQDADHLMNNFSLRQAPANPMQYRQTYTDVISHGYQLHYQQDEWIFGFDADNATHNATIFNLNNPAFLVENFNNIERDRYSLFAEWDGQLNDAWRMQTGVRYSLVDMNADAVTANGPMGAMLALQQRFNDADRDQTEHLVDLALNLTRKLSSDLDLQMGVARKQRAPSYQERYLWGPFQSTSGLADGNNYLGDINLDPETAYQFELGLDWHQPDFALSPRIFYHHINDYIQGVAATDPLAIAASTMMGDSTPLRFSNVDARLYGVDTGWFAALSDHWQLDGTISYVRGERRDTSDNLYRVAPLTARTQLSYVEPDWQLGVELVNVAAQSKVSAENEEAKTSGYSLINLTGEYQFNQQLTVYAGVNNVFDRRYDEHLGGYNRAVNPDIAIGDRIPGVGRNAYVTLSMSW